MTVRERCTYCRSVYHWPDCARYVEPIHQPKESHTMKQDAAAVLTPSSYREKLIYLAGPITGLSFAGCTEWRDGAIARLAKEGIKGLSPMRAKEYLSHLTNISGTGAGYEHLGVFSTPRGVMTRDRFDCTRCDVLLVNLLGAERVSIGTVMEIAWADLSRIPVVVAMEVGNPHEHMMVHEAIGFRLDTLDAALDTAIAILR